MRTFKARSMRAALEQVKQAYGPQAVILGTRCLPAAGVGGLVGHQTVEITAGPPDTTARAPRLADPQPAASATTPRGSAPAPQPTAPPKPATPSPRPATPSAARPGRTAQPVVTAASTGCAPGLQAAYERLVAQEVAERLAQRIIAEAAPAGGDRGQPEAVAAAVRRTLTRLLPAVDGLDLPAGARRRVVLVGPAGAGKTTTLAKLAAHFRLRARRSVAILSLDLQGLTSNELLRRYAELVGVPFHAAQTVTAAKETLAALRDVDLVLVDTFGVSPRDDAKCARLASLVRAVRPDEVHLALPAAMNAATQQRYAELFKPLGAARLILTRLDEAVGVGVVLNAVATLGLPVSYTTAGPHVPQDIERGCSRRLVELLSPCLS